jgi:hypothetical protein
MQGIQGVTYKSKLSGAAHFEQDSTIGHHFLLCMGYKDTLFPTVTVVFGINESTLASVPAFSVARLCTFGNSTSFRPSPARLRFIGLHSRSFFSAAIIASLAPSGRFLRLRSSIQAIQFHAIQSSQPRPPAAVMRGLKGCQRHILGSQLGKDGGPVSRISKGGKARSMSFTCLL